MKPSEFNRLMLRWGWAPIRTGNHGHQKWERNGVRAVSLINGRATTVPIFVVSQVAKATGVTVEQFKQGPRK